jgi:glutamine amidotransferase
MIAVLDYGIGNLHSAHQSLCHVGADARLTADHGLIADADAVVLPGVGAFGACMRALHDADLAGVAIAAAADDRPFIGICVGMQMMYEASVESPGVQGLGILAGTVDWLPNETVRPQMQWNRIDLTPTVGTTDPLLAGLDGAWMYFVHSFVGPAGPEVSATCPYGGPQTAAVRIGTTWATQFHPEKSARAGLTLLGNFVGLAAAWRQARGAA